MSPTDWGECAICGGAADGRYTPDMDITPVPLCRLCLYTEVLGLDEVRPGRRPPSTHSRREQ